MSRFMKMALLSLVAVGLAMPLVAQDNVAIERSRYYRSAMASADWPEAVVCGSSFNVDVTMVNMARTPWTEDGFHKLGPVKGEEEVFRTDGNKVKMPDGTKVDYRGQHTFTLELTAPMDEGIFDTQWSMMTGGAPYGTPITQSIRVYCNEAKLGRALFPEEPVKCGEPFTVEVRMRNNGGVAWTEAEFYKMGPVKATNEIFRPDGHKFKMLDGTEVPVGEKHVFELELMAPDSAGSYETRWTMMKSGKPFGEEIERSIEVVCDKKPDMDGKRLRKKINDGE